jgi:hypothetical protein
MSWSIEITGTKDAVKAKLIERLDKNAASYAGKPEGDDIAMCKARALALIDAIEFDDYANAVLVKANGSHSTTSSKADPTKVAVMSANFSLQVQRVALAL